ncbi:two-component system, OmpR family, sensor kinase [Nitratiruptor sp. YY08-26]|uniref:sensor histidine kinase n=1 Tax=unclassified Nitratiruptor TaxID=2624044 RepID=UPI0019386FC1|nr:MULTISPECIES: HAMP domain-containing sensor histidine kinase [unclassified Nitratiruptor]BCD61597.1 two-component system, OmpR family, sensor kinase [Nitratiruptor sp. YY08-13]BCD65531.1 two-component system, OmpR family, sensor kinase [Nitratiruptor sp. YY08-26]
MASAILIALFSTFLYSFIKQSLYEEVQEQLLRQAQFIATTVTNYHIGEKIDNFYLKKTLNISVTVIPKPQFINDSTFQEFNTNGKYFLVLFYPYNFKEQTFLKVEKDITNIHTMLHKIYKIILFTNALAFAFIILYAAILASYLTTYITNLNKKLSTMNEHMLKPIKIKDLPEEFQPLGQAINMLINRIQTFIKYQKELFIGIAHELKTPLAVMKLKNEVTLIKKRTPEEYIETIKLNIKTINEMNKMIESILKIGRQEGDQFEPPVKLDLIEYLKEKSKNYALLAESEGKKFVVELKPQTYITTIQPTLLNHIIQNFVQNAIKFTKENGTITLRSYPTAKGIKIEVIDEGPGIDTSIDLFAPFKRKGKQGGVGLGLFLAKSAADAMGATITITNRKDKKGAIATLFIPKQLACPLC